VRLDLGALSLLAAGHLDLLQGPREVHAGEPPALKVYAGEAPSSGIGFASSISFLSSFETLK
jgi:hypothetical protein